MKVVELSKFKHTKNPYGGSSPFTIYFVYPKDKEPVIVKGMAREVSEYVEKHFPISFYRITYWGDKKSRGIWMFGKEAKNRIFDYNKQTNKWEYIHFNKGKKEIKKSFRRVPHKWIVEFD